MKKQQSISRFFAAKPTSTVTPQNDASSRVKGGSSSPGFEQFGCNSSAPTVEWPPRTLAKRKSITREISSPLNAKKRAIEKVGEGFGSLNPECEVTSLSVYSQQSTSLPTQCKYDAFEVPEDGDDVGSLRTLAGLKNSEGRKCLEDELVGKEELAVNFKRRTGSRSGEKGEIPASDPVKHMKFVEKILARTDASGDVKESWYGKLPTGKEKYTPLESQVAELKAKYPDVVLMVEVGYKYRFFGNDAETAAKTLGIFAHYDHNFLTASIPTFRLHVHVRRLVEAGYKVGVVRQTETAAIKAHGSNKTGPFTRGLSALYTRATLEAAEDLGGESEGRMSRLSSYLMCVAERSILDGKRSPKEKLGSKTNGSRDSGSYDTEIGLVAVETATGDVMFSNFKDNVMRTELEGCLIACCPVELLLATPLSTPTEKILMDFAGSASEVRVERLSRECFRDGGALAEVVDFYSTDQDTSKVLDFSNDEDKIDEGLEIIMRMPDIVVQALGLALRYLKQFGLEKVLRVCSTFRPFSSQNEMNLSPNALRQLEIVKNNADGNEKGSLLWLLDQTQTAFGARLLRRWVTHPLSSHAHISARLDAVTEIAESCGSADQTSKVIAGAGNNLRNGSEKGLIGSVLSFVGRMPDLERGITRIFHRTATAAEFVSVIQALVTCAKHLEGVASCEAKSSFSENQIGEEHKKEVKSSLLQRLIAAISSETICKHANRLLSALNIDAAAAGDKLNLFNCRDDRFPEVLSCRATIKLAEEELDGFLPSFRKLLRLPNLQYMSVNGSSYLVEAPVAQRVPADWMKVSSTKKTHRYHPPSVLVSVNKLALATEQLAAACTRAWDMFMEEFSEHYIEFRASVQALAALDCLHSLAVVSHNQGYTRPHFVGDSEPPQLVIKSGRHPILDSVLQDRFVPNDTILHAKEERCQIITGPNMGGKSCYIRQVALIAIMAQVGSYVPASSAKLHVFDSVQTRMGASDSLQKGSSTFLEELNEASNILRTASTRSLVIVDELGRGTSTHDGVALAYATLHYMLKETQCLTLFVTHYPKIADLRDEFPCIANPYYVSYLAQEVTTFVKGTSERGPAEDSTIDSQGVADPPRDITFLYKLVPGVASKSFGLHVARMAQIPEACVQSASSMASQLEKLVGDREYGTDPVICTSVSYRDPSESTEVNLTDAGRILTDPSEDRGCAEEVTSSSCSVESGHATVEEAAVRDLLFQLEKNFRPNDLEASVTHLKALQRQVVTAL